MSDILKLKDGINSLGKYIYVGVDNELQNARVYSLTIMKRGKQYTMLSPCVRDYANLKSVFKEWRKYKPQAVSEKRKENKLYEEIKF